MWSSIFNSIKSSIDDNLTTRSHNSSNKRSFSPLGKCVELYTQIWWMDWIGRFSLPPLAIAASHLNGSPEQSFWRWKPWNISLSWRSFPFEPYWFTLLLLRSSAECWVCKNLLWNVFRVWKREEAGENWSLKKNPAENWNSWWNYWEFSIALQQTE